MLLGGYSAIHHPHPPGFAILSLDLVQKLLQPVYSEEERVIISSEVLHAIVSHEHPRKPLTVEAGIVRIADALDMEQGRARIPFSAGRIDIHSVSALSIERVKIETGDEKPVTIRIQMSNAAGIFQVDQLLRDRIENSGLENYIHVIATVKPAILPAFFQKCPDHEVVLVREGEVAATQLRHAQPSHDLFHRIRHRSVWPRGGDDLVRIFHQLFCQPA
jgi:metal-dependent HD superfamily phosphatase/phosphodiesterase